MKKHSMPNTYAIYLMGFSVGVFVLTIYMFLIALNIGLWWEVIDTINVSPFIIFFAIGMFFYAVFMFMIGLIMYIKKDKDTP
jgi:hypothetical protein